MLKSSSIWCFVCYTMLSITFTYIEYLHRNAGIDFRRATLLVFRLSRYYRVSRPFPLPVVWLVSGTYQVSRHKRNFNSSKYHLTISIVTWYRVLECWLDSGALKAAILKRQTSWFSVHKNALCTGCLCIVGVGLCRLPTHTAFQWFPKIRILYIFDPWMDHALLAGCPLKCLDQERYNMLPIWKTNLKIAEIQNALKSKQIATEEASLYI